MEHAINRFHIHTLGCKVNQAESESIAASLIAEGWEQTHVPQQADLAIVSTCTVTGEADAKNRKLIRSLLRESNCRIIVTGCAINIDASRYDTIDERITCEADKERIPGLAAKLVGDASAQPADKCFATALRGTGAGAFRTRVDLKIQDGCDNACSYCIVHVARGPAHSLPARGIIEDARIIARSGTREIVLVGIDLAAYHDGDTDLAALTKRLLAESGIARMRISSVEPQSVTPALIEALGSSDGSLCRHLHLCLQSGSSKVLREMNRNYDAAQFEELVTELRNACPAIALSTDVIVGFPGETDDDFEQTRELVRRCDFMRLHVFKYSKRPGTPAAARGDQVDDHMKAARSKELIALGNELALKDMQRRIGTTEGVIIERPGLGTSESYHTVLCDPSLPVGSLVELEFADVDERNSSFIAR